MPVRGRLDLYYIRYQTSLLTVREEWRCYWIFVDWQALKSPRTPLLSESRDQKSVALIPSSSTDDDDDGPVSVPGRCLCVVTTVWLLSVLAHCDTFINLMYCACFLFTSQPLQL